MEELAAFCAQMIFDAIVQIQDLQMFIDRVKALCSNAEGLLLEELFLPLTVARNGLDGAVMLQKKIFSVPRSLCLKIFPSVMEEKTLPRTFKIGFLIGTLRPNEKGLIPKGSKAILEKMCFSDKAPFGEKEPLPHGVFLSLWKLSTFPEEKEDVLVRGDRPSLVAAYEAGDIGKERMFSGFFGTPFRV